MNTVPYPWEVDFFSFLFEMLRDAALPMIVWGLVLAAMLLLAIVAGTALFLGGKSLMNRRRRT